MLHYNNPVQHDEIYNNNKTIDEQQLVQHNKLDITNTQWCIDKCMELLGQCTTYYRDAINSNNYNKSLYNGTLALPTLNYILYESNLNRNHADRHNILLNVHKYIDILYQQIVTDHQIGTHHDTTPSTFIIGHCTVLCMNAVVKSLLNESYDDFIQQLIDMSTRVLHINADEVLYGKVGYIQMMLFLLDHGILDSIDQQHIQLTISSVLDSIISDGEQLEHNIDSPLMWQWHGKFYLGHAHGLSGILSIILRCRWYLNDSRLICKIRQTIEYCMKQCYPSGNYKSSIESDNDRLVQWCHGSTSLALLCIEAYQHFSDDKHLQCAVNQSNIIWERGLLNKGVGLCHGISGNAAVFLHLYQITNNKLYLRRAEYFMEFGLNSQYTNELFSQPDDPYSLYNGIGGAVLVMCDLIDIRNDRQHKLQLSAYGL